MKGKITNYLLSNDDRSEAGGLPQYRVDLVRDVLNALDDPLIVDFPCNDYSDVKARLKPMVKDLDKCRQVNPTFGPDNLWADDADFCALCVMIAAVALRYVERVYQTRDIAVATAEANAKAVESAAVGSAEWLRLVQDGLI